MCYAEEETNPLPGSHGCDLDCISEVLEPVNESQPQRLLAFVAVVEVVCAQFLVECAVLEHVIGGGEHGGGDGANGLFGAAPGTDAQVLAWR